MWEDDSGPFKAIRAQLFDPIGNRLGGERIIISQPGNDEVLPTVTALAGGGFYVNWTQPNGPDNYILGRVYDANGAFVRDQTAVFAFGQDNHADNARLGAGSVVVWQDPDANSGDIDLRIFDASGTGGSVITANSTTAGAQYNPSVSVAPDGGKFAVVWTTGTSTINGGVFTPQGTEFSPDFQVSTLSGIQGGGIYGTDVAWLNNGQFAVTWEDNNSVATGSDEIRVKIFSFHNPFVTPLTGDILVNSTIFDSQRHPQIVALASGGFVVAWDDASGVGGDSSLTSIKLQAFDASGTKIGGEMLVNTTTASSQFEPSISALPDGRVVVSWTDFSSGSGDIRAQIVDPRDGIIIGTSANDILYGHDAVGDEINGLAGNDTEFGLKGTDTLYGGEGNDLLKGGQGDDTLYGGAGVDTASFVDKFAAVVVALAGSNEAVVTVGGNAEDSLFEIENVSGGSAADTLTGDGLANVLNGNNGDDILRGSGGNDSLSGGNGLDRLTGGAGLDNLNGGADNDTFVYLALGDSGTTAASRDQISGFAAGDKIDVHLIDAIAGGTDDAFVLDTDGSFSQGEIKQTVQGSNLLIEFNADANAAADMSILLVNHTTLLGSGDFVL